MTRARSSRRASANAVMNAGRLVQIGAPETLYREPDTAFVARFLGGSNIVAPGRLAEAFAPTPAPASHVLAVRPENVQFGGKEGIEARVLSRQFLGTYAEYWFEAEGQRLRVWADPAVPAPSETAYLTARDARWVKGDA